MRAHLNRIAGASLLMAGFGFALTASSCANPATEIVAGFTTQIQVPKELRSVVVVITQGGRPIRCRVYRVTDGTVKLPGTIGIIPAEDRDGVPPEPVNVSVLGFRVDLPNDFETQCFLGALPNTAEDGETPNEVLVVRRAALQYTEERIVFTRMPLKESCSDVFCTEEQTCVGGKCEDATIDGAALPEYRDDLIFGDTNTCFEPELCMAGASLAVMTDKANCTFRLPVPEDLEDQTPQNPGALNVEVVYSSLGTEILDLDDREGFTFPDENDPWTFRLAPNLCESQFLDPPSPKILGVYASPLCFAKRPLQPICSDALDGIQSGQRAPASNTFEQGNLCPIGPPLQATESLLYVLMDRSASMAEFFGPDGLQFAVGIPLENPIAARTRLAFSFMPADQTECDPGNSYETPMFGFAEPDMIRGDIASALGSTMSLLPGAPASDPEVYMDAALGGAYTALHAINDSQSATFNRKAVVLVGNRDFQSHCGNAALDEMAATALADADPIHTYVAVLNAPSDAPGFGAPNPQSAGADVANSGGTSVFDAVQDETEGALAVQKVLNDLGSCLYDPLTVDPRFPQEEVAFLSFVNPLNQQATIVERNDACTSPDVNIDGFSIDADDQVVICGQPCQTLRDALTDTASYYAILQQPAPAIPIRPSLTCARKNELLDDLLMGQ